MAKKSSKRNTTSYKTYQGSWRTLIRRAAKYEKEKQPTLAKALRAKAAKLRAAERRAPAKRRRPPEQTKMIIRTRVVPDAFERRTGNADERTGDTDALTVGGDASPRTAREVELAKIGQTLEAELRRHDERLIAEFIEGIAIARANPHPSGSKNFVNAPWSQVDAILRALKK